jgi:hypothetical protein
MRRDAMYALWSQAGIATTGSRGLHILGHLAQTGLICFGPRDGKQHTLTLVEEWLPRARLLDRESALGTLAGQYFTGHGPATVHDFAWWSGLTVTDARVGIELAKGQLESDVVDGRTLWFGSHGKAPSGATVYLLPAWDEYTVAYRDRADILDAKHSARVNAGGGVLKPVVVAGSRVVGTWQRTIGKAGVAVRPSLFKRLDRDVADAVDRAVARYSRFLGFRPSSHKQSVVADQR